MYDNMLDLNAQCTMKQPQHIEALVDTTDHDQLKALSQYCILSCFCSLTFCDPVHGIFGAQPGDMLHMFNLDIVKNVIIEFLDCLHQRKRSCWMMWVGNLIVNYDRHIENISHRLIIHVVSPTPNKNKGWNTLVCCMSFVL